MLLLVSFCPVCPDGSCFPGESCGMDGQHPPPPIHFYAQGAEVMGEQSPEGPRPDLAPEPCCEVCEAGTEPTCSPAASDAEVPPVVSKRLHRLCPRGRGSEQDPTLEGTCAPHGRPQGMFTSGSWEGGSSGWCGPPASLGCVSLTITGTCEGWTTRCSLTRHHTRSHTHTHMIHTHTRSHTRSHMIKSSHTCSCTHAHTQSHVCTHRFTCTHIHVHSEPCSLNLHTLSHVFSLAHMLITSHDLTAHTHSHTHSQAYTLSHTH